jgi:hypothetical protein
MSNSEFDQNTIQKIMTQTTYNEEEAKEKLRQFQGDFMKVLKDYMGIKVENNTSNSNANAKKVKSINQEIYRQIRHTLDNSMKEYRDKHPLDMEQISNNLKESEEREKEIKK